MTTVTNVKRALEEFGALPGGQYGHSMTAAAQLLASDPTACTMIANSLADMGRAGNAARDANLATLQRLLSDTRHRGTVGKVAALEWAIDQLSRPRPFNAGDTVGAARNPALLYVVDQVNDDGTLNVHIKGMDRMRYSDQPSHLFVPHVAASPDEPQMMG